MSPVRRWLPVLAAAAVWIGGAAFAIAYAPRLTTPEIPSSPPISAPDVVSEPVRATAFTLNPRMGFFAAGQQE